MQAKPPWHADLGGGGDGAGGGGGAGLADAPRRRNTAAGAEGVGRIGGAAAGSGPAPWHGQRWQHDLYHQQNQAAGDDCGRSDRRRSRSRSRGRSRSRSRSRGRGRSRSRSRGRDRDSRRRSHSRSRSRSRSRGRRRAARTSSRRDSRSRSRSRSRGRVRNGGGGRLHSRYAASLEAGLDGNLDGGGRPSARVGLGYPLGGDADARGGRAPSAWVFVKGIPEAVEEADLHKLFSGFGPIKTVQPLRDRATGAPRGMARVEFADAAAAAALMGTEARHNVFVGGVRLRVEYDANPGPEAGARHGAAPLDWICDMCQEVNFGWRHSCRQCNTARPAVPRTVEAAAQEPSTVLRVSGLEPQTGEAELCELFNPTAAIVDCRLVNDKFTGQPRGFAFLEFRSIAEAGRAMQACQGAAPPGQAGGLRISYARGRDAADATALKGFVAASHGRIGGDVGQGAAAEEEADPYAGWAPKEFDATAVAVAGGDAAAQQAPGGGAQQQEARQAGGPDRQGAQQQQDQQQAAGAGAGFQYDEASGYWFDSGSGYYWDQATGLYYHQAANQWLALDQESGQFAPVGGGNGQAQAEDAQPIGPQPRQQPAAQQQQQQQQVDAIGPQPHPAGPQPQPRAVGPAVPRRSATIGAAPQLNAQGLLTIVAVEEEREKEERRRQKILEQRAEQQQQQQQQRQRPPPAAAPAPPVAATAQGQGGVAGVVYQSTWAQRRQQMGGQR